MNLLSRGRYGEFSTFASEFAAGPVRRFAA
jgi:hypothetical protein